MIVQCPQCDSQYRVQDDKIPASGGKISCPNCGNRFVVHPDDEGPQAAGDAGGTGGGGSGETSEDTTSAVNANRLAQMAEGMEGEDVDESADAGDVDKTEVMQGPNVPDFMAEDQEGGAPDESGDDGTREMRNPFSDEGSGKETADDTTTDVSKDELMGDIDDSTEVWDGVDAIQDMHGEGESGEGPSLQTHEGGGSDQGVDRGQAGQSQSGGTAPAADSAPVNHQGQKTGPAPQQESSGPPAGPADESGPQRQSEGQQSAGDGKTAPAGQSGAHQQVDGGQSPPSSSPSDQQTPVGGGQSSPASQSGNQPVVGGGQSAPASQSGSQPVQGGDQSSGVPTVDNSSESLGAEDGPAPGHEGPWKLKAEHGLTYEFPETEALRDWLNDRDSIEDFELSADDGSSFYELGEFPQVSDLVGGGSDASASGSQQMAARGRGNQQPRGQRGSSSPPSTGGGRPGGGRGGGRPGGPSTDGGSPPASGGGAAGSSDQSPPAANDGPSWDDALGSEPVDEGTGGGDADPAPSPKPVSNDGFELPSRDAIWNKVLYGIVFVLLLAATGLFLEVAKIYPAAKYIPGVPSTFESDEGAEGGLETSGGGAEAGAADNKAQAQPETSEDSSVGENFKRLIEAADESIENNRLQTAIEKLKGAKMVDPERPEIYERLAEVYEKLGQGDKAEKNRKKARELKGDTEAPSGEKAGAGSGDGDGESAE